MFKLIAMKESENDPLWKELLPFCNHSMMNDTRILKLASIKKETNTEVLGNKAYFNVEHYSDTTTVMNIGMYSDSCDYRVNFVSLFMANKVVTQWVNKQDEYDNDHGDLILLITAT